MSFYVERSRDGRTGWTGPIRSARQADKEAAAWQSAGWIAQVVESTPEVRAAVRAWERAKPDFGRVIVTAGHAWISTTP